MSLDGDSMRCSYGDKYELPVTVNLYWKGWTDAVDLVRESWPVVESLALACIAKRSLTASVVLEICEPKECGA